MKKISIKLIALLIIAGTSLNGFAQSDIANLFKAGITDLNKVANGYMKPMGTGFAANLGSNWYNTGAPHKIGGFDITLGFGVAMAPTKDQTFSLAGLTRLTAVNGEKTAPSFAGSGKGVVLVLNQPATTVNGVNVPAHEVARFNTPDGVSKMVPGVSAQLGVGLPFGTQIMIRYLPTVNTQGYNMGMWGVGVQHNIKQWIPGIKEIPIDLSAVVGYTKFTMGYDFAAADMITPDKLVGTGIPYVAPTGVSFNNQKIALKSSAFTVNVVVSKKLLFFTPYLGVGVTKSKFDLGFKGNFPVLGDLITSGANAGSMDVQNMKDPIKISTNNFMPNATIGFRLKILWVLSLHAQYTMQKYPIISGGFGINIR